jgi:hypothetical protein
MAYPDEQIALVSHLLTSDQSDQLRDRLNMEMVQFLIKENALSVTDLLGRIVLSESAVKKIILLLTTPPQVEIL